MAAGCVERGGGFQRGGRWRGWWRWPVVAVRWHGGLSVIHFLGSIAFHYAAEGEGMNIENVDSIYRSMPPSD